jgi:hypothetical protein
MVATKSFTLFHFSLVPIEQLDLETLTELSREAWVRLALSRPFSFHHRSESELHWVPREVSDDLIIGLLEKQRPHVAHRPPDKGGEEMVVEEWQGAWILIDPTHHDEGQRVAVENDVVGDPQAMLRSLVAAINHRSDKPYHIESEPLFDGSRFWTFSEQHNHLMRSVEFDFVVPNMWGTESDLEEDLKDTGEQTGAQRVRVGFDSEDGVRTQNTKVKEGVNYAEKGAGTIRARAMDGGRFYSNRQPLKTRLKIEKDASLAEGFLRHVKDLVLGRS